jgi:thiamine biosynthesis lipoprotein
MSRSTQKVGKTYRALGTVIDLIIYGTGSEQDLDDAYRLIQSYEDKLTVNRPQSELMTLRDNAGRHAVQFSNATYTLVKKAVQESQQHYGFDTAIGPLVKLWHIGFADARVPTDAEIQQRKNLISPDQIVLDDHEFAVYLPEKGMEIDLGGIAKGYIADRIQDLWCSRGISSAIINLGGNLVLMGEAPHQVNHKWRVGIRNPLNPEQDSIAQVQIGAASVVTSGISERHLDIANKSYHHIIDPETGYPHDNNIASVTVFSKYSVDGEIETTRLFFADKPLTGWLENNSDLYGALFVYRDKKIKLVGLSPQDVRLYNNDYKIE